MTFEISEKEKALIIAYRKADTVGKLGTRVLLGLEKNTPQKNINNVFDISEYKARNKDR